MRERERSKEHYIDSVKRNYQNPHNTMFLFSVLTILTYL